MTSQLSILGLLSKNLVEALNPLRTGFRDLTSFRSLMLRLGWKVTSIPPEYQDVIDKVTAAKDALEALADNPGLDDILAVLEKVKVAYLAIKNISAVPSGVDAGPFLDELREKLFELLLADYLAAKLPTVSNILEMTGVIQREYIKAEGSRPGFIRTNIKFGDIPDILKNPLLIPERIYGWGGPDLNFELVATHLMELFTSFGLSASYETIHPKLKNGYQNLLPQKPVRPSDYQLRIQLVNTRVGDIPVVFGLKLLELPPGEDNPNAGLILQPDIPALANTDFQVAQNLSLHLREGMDPESALAILFRPGELSVRYPFSPGSSFPAGGFGISLKYELPTSSILLGGPGSTRVQFKGWEGGIGVDQSEEGFDFRLDFSINQLELILAISEQDGFLGKLFGGKDLNILTQFGIHWSNQKGLSFSGGAGFEVVSTPHIELGPVTIEQLRFGIRSQSDPDLPASLIASATASFNTKLGPILVLVQDTGVDIHVVFKDGNAGPFDVSAGFKSPSGVGLSIDAGGIKGGGTLNLNPEKGEYFGSLELEFKDLFTLKAYGIINTKLPDGSKGFSMLIVVTAEFNPIQLGFGFTLNGVGGLFGLNRTTKIEILKEGIKTNAIKSILFPEDVVANINRIVSDVSTVFPPQPGHFLMAPMAKIAWGTPALITLELGLLIEIPSSRLIILGVLKALLPDESKPLLKLQVNFIGEIDFENKTISFDAILYDSTLLTFTLSGQMAMRLAWGDNKVFVLTVGGFHPAFKEIPKGLEQMQRLTIMLINTDDVRITIQNYFAVTSNTVQFGARAELYASHGSWNIYGYVGYDVLFQFDPFQFIADFSAGLALRRHESVIMGISVSGTLAGPSPWDAKGEASVSFFFFSVSVPFHKTWGDTDNSLPAEKADLIGMLTALIEDDRSWAAAIPPNKNLHVSIKKITLPPGKLVIHPFGILTFSERLVPLGIDIDKFGNKLPLDARHFDIDVAGDDLDTDKVNEQFAPANFLQMTDDQKLARRSFESMQSGFKITGSQKLIAPMAINKSVDYEFSYLGRKKRTRPDRYRFEKLAFQKNTGGGVIATSPLSYSGRRISSNAPEAVVVETENFVIAYTSNLQLYSEAPPAASYTEASQHYREMVRIDPSLKDKLQVLAVFELNTN